MAITFMSFFFGLKKTTMRYPPDKHAHSILARPTEKKKTTTIFTITANNAPAKIPDFKIPTRS
jgi:hypothetical protein